MANLSRLAKLEKAVNGSRKRIESKPIDLSHLSDAELKNLYQDSLDQMDRDYDGRYDGMTDQELSDLYMETIKAGNKNQNR